MFEIFKAVITRGGYDLNGILKRIDSYHIEGKLTDSERDQLYALARGGGISAGFDVEAEIARLWEAIRELKANGNIVEDGGNVDAGNIAEYNQPTGAHDAYYAGDLVSYGGKVYECIAPEGVACVWNPDVMPGYWDELEA